MECHLIKYCQEHFQKVPPLLDLLNSDSLTLFGEQVPQGTADFSSRAILHDTKLLLQHQ